MIETNPGSRTKHMNVNVKAQPCKKLKLFSTNGAGVVGGKVESLKSEVKHTQCNIVTLQETHCKVKGKIQLENFVVLKLSEKKKVVAH